MYHYISISIVYDAIKYFYSFASVGFLDKISVNLLYLLELLRLGVALFQSLYHTERR